MKLITFTGKTVYKKIISVSAKAGLSKKILTVLLAQTKAKPNEVFLSVEGGNIPGNECFFAPYKACDLAKTNISTIIRSTKTGFEISLLSKKPAFYVSLEVLGMKGIFNDNCFTLLPNKRKKIIFTLKKAITLSKFKKALKVHHLRATYK